MMMSKRLRTLLAILILPVCLLPVVTPTTVAASPAFLAGPHVRPNPNPAVPLAAVLTFETNGKVNTRVEIKTGDDCRVLTLGPEMVPREGLPLVGFSPGLRHEIVVTLSDVDGKSPPRSARVEFTAPPIPSEIEAFPIIEAKRLSDAAMEPGVTMFNPRRRIPPGAMSPSRAKRFNQGFGMLVAVNAAGDVIWYYQCDSRISDFEPLRNGNIVFLTQDYQAVEIDLLGNIVTRWYAEHRPQGELANATPVDALTFHHDIDELPNGNFLVLGSERRRIPNYYANETDERAPRKPQWVMGDEVVEFRRDGKVVWRWNAFEHLDVYRIGYQTFSGYWERRGFPGTICWSHGNALAPLDDGSLLVNFRHLSAITKIDRSTGRISWIAGEPTGWSDSLREKLLTMQGDGKWFWHEHAPTITPGGTLLLFDNGNFQTRPFDSPLPPDRTRSRMVEYTLDEEKMSLCQRWSSVIPGDPPVVSFAMGSTQYLPRTGNLLAGYGFLMSPEAVADENWDAIGRGRAWTRVREYTHDSPSEVVWELTLRARENEIGLGWNLFGARRVASFPPHPVVCR